MTETSFLKLKKPDKSDRFNVENMNGNSEIIADAIKLNSYAALLSIL